MCPMISIFDSILTLFTFIFILYSGDQNHFSQQQQQQQQAHQLSAGVSGLTPTNGVFASSVLTSTSTSVINAPEDNTVSTASSVYISLPQASTTTPVEQPAERREQKTGGKGTFSSISAVAAAAGHVNPLLKPTQLDDSAALGPVKNPTAIPSGPPFQPPSSSLTANLGIGPLGIIKTAPGPRIPGSSVDEISLPQRSLGQVGQPGPPLLGRETTGSVPAVAAPSAEVPSSTVGAVKSAKAASGKPPIVKEKVSTKEVKISRTSQTKAQREKVKERKAREVAEKEQEKEAEKEAEKEKEREREKEKEKEKEREKEREREKEKERLKEEKERDAAAAAIASAVVTHHDLKLESVTSLTRRKEVTTAKLIALERKAMIARKGPPPYLPRPKVHWDYLLDEMQWMSIDFKQERRLKLALCHSISLMCSAAAIERINRSNERDLERQKAIEREKKKEKEMEVEVDVVSRQSLNSVGSTQNSGCTDTACETDNSILESTPMDLGSEIPVPIIIHPTILSSADKIKNKKIVASTISDMIKHHWQATSDAIEVHNKEAIQLLKVYKEYQEEEIDEEISPVTPSPLPLPLPSTTPEMTEVSTKRIKEKEILLKCLQDTAKFNGSTETSDGVDLTELSHQHYQRNKSLSSMILLKHQLYALKQTIDRNNSGYGVLLCGKNYSGRTALCAVIAETWLSSYTNNNTGKVDSGNSDATTVVKTEEENDSANGGITAFDEKNSDGPGTESGIHSKYFQTTQSSPHNEAYNTESTITRRKKPVLVLVPRCGLVRWYSELKRTYTGCNVQLGLKYGKNHDSIKVEKKEENKMDKEVENDGGKEGVKSVNKEDNGTCNVRTSGIEGLGSEPDIILCALESIHVLLEHLKMKNLNAQEESLNINMNINMNGNGNIRNTGKEKECDWCGVIIDSRSLNMAAMKTSMLLFIRAANPEISNTETAVKKQSDVGLKIKQEGRIYTSTAVIVNQATAVTNSTVPVQNTIKKKKDKHWLCCLSDLLPSTLSNRCYIRSEKQSETTVENNSLLSFLIPELRSTAAESPVGGTVGAPVHSPLPMISNDMNEVEVLRRLCVHVEVSQEDDVIAHSRAHEEIVTYDLGHVQRRKYAIAMDYFTSQGVFSGANISNLAKATIIIKRLCYHQDMIYIDVENEGEMIEKSNVKNSSTHSHARTKSDLTIKDLPKNLTEGKEKNSSASTDLGSVIPKENKIPSDDNNSNETNDMNSVDNNEKNNDEKNHKMNDNDSTDNKNDNNNNDNNSDKNGNNSSDPSSSSDMKMDVCTDIILACTDKTNPSGQETLENDRNIGAKNGKGTDPSFTLVNPQRYNPTEEAYLSGTMSYRTTSPAYVPGSKQHLWFSVGFLLSKLRSPVSFNMTSYRSNSPLFNSSSLSASLSPSFTASSSTNSPVVYTERSNGDDTPNFRKNSMTVHHNTACVGSYKLQALEGLLLRFIGQRVAILSETEEEMLAVHRYVRVYVCVSVRVCVCTCVCLYV
jgi:HSA